MTATAPNPDVTTGQTTAKRHHGWHGVLMELVA